MRDFIDSNILWIAPIFSFIVAQLLKYVIYAIRYKVSRKERLTGAGGMPSSHSSGVCTMMVIMARAFGMGSPYFAIPLMFGLIVMYDAAGVRRAAGLHARVINMLKISIDDLDDNVVNFLKLGKSDKSGGTESNSKNVWKNAWKNTSEKSGKEEKPLKEFVGHTPLEVICGAILGIFIGFMVSLDAVM